LSTLSDKVLNLPAAPGVYLFKDPSGRVLYVGKAKSLQHRVRSYLTGDNAHVRLDELMGRANDLDTILTDTEAEALLLEATLIRQHRPHFNILLKDDKSFPYVKISLQEPFPRLSITRQVRQDGARYLGPYTDVKNLRRTLREIRRIFPIRTCQNFEDYQRKNRPCLYYHIRRCMGPCTTRARVEAADYRSMVDGLIWFLSGRDHELVDRLRAEMEQASSERRFEAAARRRDQLRLLERARVPQKVVRATGGSDADILGVARHGDRAAVAALLLRGGRVVGKETRVLERPESYETGDLLHAYVTQRYLGGSGVPRRLVTAAEPAEAALLAEALARHAGHRVDLETPSRGRERRLVAIAERNAAHALEDMAARQAGRRARFSPEILELQQALGLAVPPHRMICFDISNLGGEAPVAAIVASENGRPRKSLYRRMRMRRGGPDDFAMIAEAVERYWARVESGELPRPDLVMVDGGAGQVTAARAALDLVATAPVPLIGLAKREETVMREDAPPLRLPRRSPALRALQRLRDEAHRFGLDYHRRLRTRSRVASALESIPGVGPARRIALLRAFGSVEAMRGASAADLAARAGIPPALAARIAAGLGGDSPPARDAGTAGAAPRRRTA
jgi:excinuclease ABC subunit C